MSNTIKPGTQNLSAATQQLDYDKKNAANDVKKLQYIQQELKSGTGDKTDLSNQLATTVDNFKRNSQQLNTDITALNASGSSADIAHQADYVNQLNNNFTSGVKDLQSQGLTSAGLQDSLDAINNSNSASLNYANSNAPGSDSDYQGAVSSANSDSKFEGGGADPYAAGITQPGDGVSNLTGGTTSTGLMTTGGTGSTTGTGGTGSTTGTGETGSTGGAGSTAALGTQNTANSEAQLTYDSKNAANDAKQIAYLQNQATKPNADKAALGKQLGTALDNFHKNLQQSNADLQALNAAGKSGQVAAGADYLNQLNNNVQSSAKALSAAGVTTDGLDAKLTSITQANAANLNLANSLAPGSDTNYQDNVQKANADSKPDSVEPYSLGHTTTTAGVNDMYKNQ